MVLPPFSDRSLAVSAIGADDDETNVAHPIPSAALPREDPMIVLMIAAEISHV